MTTEREHGLGRIEEFDPRSLSYPIRALLTAGEQPQSRLWPCEVWLDQGAVGACVGFSFAAELAAEPVPIPGISNADGMRIYKAAQQLDPWPGDNYEGTSVLAGAKVMQAENRITEYRWAFGLDDLILALGHKGPAVLGVLWYEAMYDPDPDGLLHVSGRVLGGHAILAVGVDIERRRVRLHNSWSRNWGLNGDAFISFDDLGRLLGEGGEACIPLVRVGSQPPPPPPEPQPEPEVPMTILDARNEVTNPRGNGATIKAQVIGIAVHHSVTQTPSELGRSGMADVVAQQAIQLASVAKEMIVSAVAASTEASERAIIRAIDAYHSSIGYGGFAYHMAVFPSGRAYLCGDLGARRAHVAQRNHELIGIVLIGTFTTVLPGERQMDGLREALLAVLDDYPGREIRGHREWALPGEGTACPGVVVPRDWQAFLEEEQYMKRFNAVAAGFAGKHVTTEWIDAQTAFGLPSRPRRVRIEVYLSSGEVTIQDGRTGAYAGRVGWAGQNYGVVEAETEDGYFGLIGDAIVANLGIVAYS